MILWTGDGGKELGPSINVTAGAGWVEDVTPEGIPIARVDSIAYVRILVSEVEAHGYPEWWTGERLEDAEPGQVYLRMGPT